MLNFIFGKPKYFKPDTDDYVIISVYFNPQDSEYRRKAFKQYYDSIKHLNHKIIECVIGDSKSDLSVYAKKDKDIEIIRADSLLWHKESLINYAVKKLDPKYKYVFWIDADVTFKNLSWVVLAINELKTHNIIQLFSVCYHLDKDQKPEDCHKNNKAWLSFCTNWKLKSKFAKSEIYDLHGHVGFAWGATREVLDAVPLYDKCLVGGADHIVAHAASGQFNFPCITKAFKEELKEIDAWQRKFYEVVQGKIGYVSGILYHTWHGDITKRQYLKRIKDFDGIQKDITTKDENGLYVANKKQEKYVKEYFDTREVKTEKPADDGFFSSMFWGYVTNNPIAGYFMGGNLTGSYIGSTLNTSEETPKNIEVESQVTIPNIEQPANEPEIVPQNNEPVEPFTSGEVITNEGVFTTGDSFGGEVDTNENFS